MELLNVVKKVVIITYREKNGTISFIYTIFKFASDLVYALNFEQLFRGLDQCLRDL